MPSKRDAPDPRIFQIVALGALVALGIGWLQLPIDPAIASVIVIAALLTQRVAIHPPFDPLSPLISALSLTLLLRTNDPAVAAAAAALAIGSKALIRIDGTHLFNPTAFALVLVTSVCDAAWISPGQWGHAMPLCVAVAGGGCVVAARAARLDTSLAFLGTFSLVVFARGAWLGDPLAVTVHQLNNGALLVFAFFMISDPRTTPARRGGRIAFAAAVALLAAVIEFVLYRPNGAIVALVLCAPLVVLCNRSWRMPPVQAARNGNPVSTRPLLRGEHHVFD